MKQLKHIANAGPFLMLGGLLYYQVTNLWDAKVQTIFYTGAALTLLLIGLNAVAIKASFKRRSMQYGANTLLMVVVVVGILGLVNYLGKKHHYRVDLSSDKLYSLSDQSVKIVKGLKAEVTILVFDKEPKTDMNDLLTEYKDLNTSKIIYRVVDPNKNPSQARKYNIQTMGDTVVLAGEKFAKVDSAQETAVTNAILKVTSEKNKVIYFSTGHNEADPASEEGRGFAQAKKGLEGENYQVKTINLATIQALPDDCTAVVIAGPKGSLLPTEIQLLDKYVDAGGKLLLMQGSENNAGMDQLLKKWKIGLDADVVVDDSPLGQLLGLGAAAPLVTSYETHPLTSAMSKSTTFFPMSRSVEILTEPGSAFNATALFKTSEGSWGEKNVKNNEARFDEGVDIKGPVTLGVASTKAVDADIKTKTYGKEARVVVIGDCDFAMNAYFDKAGNGDLFLNALSWLAEDEELISIRPKNPENRTFELTRARGTLLFWLVLVFIPLGALVSGIVVWVRRR